MAINQDIANKEILQKQKEYIDNWKTRNSNFDKLPDAFRNNDYVLFPREYFSGSDIFVSFGNIPVENIVSIEYQIQQNALPIYGYASFTWDAISMGNRQVIGSFKINYKDSFYIKSVLDKLLGKESYSSKVTSVDLSGVNTINELTEKIRGLDQEDLRIIAKEYEDRLWGSSDPIDKRYETFILNPFTTRDYINSESTWSSSYNPLLKNGFDIIISFGEEIYEIKGQKHLENNTMKIINGVQILGCRTICEPNGTPIYEDYNFIARDVDNSVSAILPKEVEEKLASGGEFKAVPINKGSNTNTGKIVSMVE